MIFSFFDFSSYSLSRFSSDIGDALAGAVQLALLLLDFELTPSAFSLYLYFFSPCLVPDYALFPCFCFFSIDPAPFEFQSVTRATLSLF